MPDCKIGVLRKKVDQKMADDAAKTAPKGKAGKKGAVAPKVEEVVKLGPAVREGEEVFAVAHIYASFNDTFVHVTDPSGRETVRERASRLSIFRFSRFGTSKL
jgi:hypothetical protein